MQNCLDYWHAGCLACCFTLLPATVACLWEPTSIFHLSHGTCNFACTLYIEVDILAFVVTAHLVGTMRVCRQCSQVAVCIQVGSKLDRPAATEEATTTEAPAEGADGWEA